MYFGFIGAFAEGPSSYCNSLIATLLSNHIFLAYKLKEEWLIDDYKPAVAVLPRKTRQISLSSWQQDWAAAA